MNTAVLRGFETGGVGAIGNHQGDLGVEPVFGDGVGDGQEIRASTGEKNAEALHLYTTRGPRARVTSPILYHCSFSLSRALQAFSVSLADTTKIMPMPRLKVRRQSASGISPILRRSSKTGSTGQDPTLIRTPSPFGKMRGVLSVIPPPVMCAAPFRMP